MGPELLDVVPMTEAFARMMSGQRDTPGPPATSSTPYEWRPRLSRSKTRKAMKQEIEVASSVYAPRPTPRKREAETAVDQPSAASSSTATEQPVLKTPRGSRSSQ